MFKLFLTAFSIFLFFMFAPGQASAEYTSPVGLSVVTLKEHAYLQFPGPNDDVMGVRLGLLRSVNKEVSGVDIGVLFNIVAGNFAGIELAGLVNNVYGNARVAGLQLAGLLNIDHEATVVGVQAAGLANRVIDSGTIAGLQLALALNDAPRADIYGAQVALVNRARKVVGFQLGLFNSADSLFGVQIGLININRGGPVKFFPVVNVGF